MTESSKHITLLAGALLILSIASFGGLFDQPWSYDDEPHVQKAARVAHDLFAIFNPDSKEPLRFVSHLYFLLLYVITPAGPASYHAGNVILHLLNTLLLVRVVGHTFSPVSPRWRASYSL